MSTHKLTLHLFLAALFVALPSFLGCRKGSQEAPPASLTLQLVHGPELRSYLSSIREQFYLMNPKLPEETLIRVELLSEMGAAAAKRIASGELKNDAWIASSSTLVNLANSTRVNLGPEQGNCLPLFRTPMVAAVKPTQALMMGAKDSHFSWRKLLGSLFPTPSMDSAPFTFSHAQPKSSTTGLASILELAYLSSGQNELSPELLESEGFKQKMKAIEQLVVSYPLSENFLLQKTAMSSDTQLRFALTTEQQVLQFNAQKPKEVSELMALFPTEGSYWEDYQLCTSLADWVTPAREAALKIFSQFLRSEPARKAARDLGFRVADPSPISDQQTPSTPPPPSPKPEILPKNSFAAVSGLSAQTLLNQWQDLRRPGALILGMDQSGSMEGDALSIAKEQFRTILARSSSHDLKALVAFGTDAKVLGSFTNDGAALVAPLDILQALGGSSVYDGIKLAFDLASRNELSAYRKSIVIVTDGDDKNSEISLTSLLGFVHERANLHAIDLIVVAINREGANFSDLERIVHSADGTLRITSLMELESTMQDLTKGL